MVQNCISLRSSTRYRPKRAIRIHTLTVQSLSEARPCASNPLGRNQTHSDMPYHSHERFFTPSTFTFTRFTLSHSTFIPYRYTAARPRRAARNVDNHSFRLTPLRPSTASNPLRSSALASSSSPLSCTSQLIRAPFWLSMSAMYFAPSRFDVTRCESVGIADIKLSDRFVHLQCLREVLCALWPEAVVHELCQGACDGCHSRHSLCAVRANVIAPKGQLLHLGAWSPCSHATRHRGRLRPGRQAGSCRPKLWSADP